MIIIREKISRKDFMDFAGLYVDKIKAVVDIERKVIALGGDMHADEEYILLDEGSVQDDLWGINIRLNETLENRVEFDSMINIRPRQGNRTRGVDDVDTQKRIIEVVNDLIGWE